MHRLAFLGSRTGHVHWLYHVLSYGVPILVRLEARMIGAIEAMSRHEFDGVGADVNTKQCRRHLRCNPRSVARDHPTARWRRMCKQTQMHLHVDPR
jgi:hypothetical protein